MRPTFVTRAAAALVSVCMISLGFAHVAHAGVIGTRAVAASADRAARVEIIQKAIMSDQVSSQLVALGVDPASAAARVSSMTDSELARLNANMEQMPNGAGVVEIVGVVFIVLLILEFTGVIDIFKKPETSASK
jgi:uncharacterized membrane protein (Fun14 family)